MSTPYRLWEILQRSYTGPHCEEDDFLPKIFTPKLQEVIKKYEIAYDPKTPVPANSSTRLLFRSSLRTLWLRLSEIKRFPSASARIPAGESSGV